MAERLQPADVFTPSHPVRRDMFASRKFKDLQRRFEDKLSEPGAQVVLYGDTGVGKTSLVEHMVDQLGLNMVTVECGAEFQPMIEEALAEAGVTREVAETITKVSGSASAGATLLSLFKASGSAERTRTTKSETFAVSLSRAARVGFDAQKVDIVFLDNFENLRAQPHSGQTVTDLVQFMKSCSATGVKVKCVVAGIPEQSEKLIRTDPATGRRINQILVPRMQDDELDEILSNGERALGMVFDPFVRARIIENSDGFPYYTHLHALHACRLALRKGEDRVTLEHFDGALQGILEDADLTLGEAYRDATETSGTVRTRRSILEAIASLHKPEVRFREIKQSFWRLHPSYESLEKLDFINPHLGDLVEKYGILQTKGLAKSADRTYRFANPLMRVYVKLKREEERQGRLDLNGV